MKSNEKLNLDNITENLYYRTIDSFRQTGIKRFKSLILHKHNDVIVELLVNGTMQFNWCGVRFVPKTITSHPLRLNEMNVVQRSTVVRS